MINCDIYWRK